MVYTGGVQWWGGVYTRGYTTHLPGWGLVPRGCTGRCHQGVARALLGPLLPAHPHPFVDPCLHPFWTPFWTLSQVCVPVSVLGCSKSHFCSIMEHRQEPAKRGPESCSQWVPPGYDSGTLKVDKYNGQMAPTAVGRGLSKPAVGDGTGQPSVPTSTSRVKRG